MKLTFIPAPGSPCRVISADDSQPEESWSPQATNKRVAPLPAPPSRANPPTATVAHAASLLPAALPGPSATENPSYSSPACTDPSDFLEPLARGCCPNCPDRPLLF